MKKRKRTVIIVVLIIIFLSVGVYYYESSNLGSDNKTTYTVKKGTIIRGIEETGEVVSKKVNTFYSDMSKKASKLNVSIGDSVKKGDILLVYDNNIDLQIQRTQKQLDALTATYNEETKGVDFEQVSNVKLSLNNIETNLDLVKSNFEKTKALYEQNAISKAEYDKAENELKQYENQLEMAYNEYDLLTKDVSENIKKKYEAQIDELSLTIQILEKSKEDIEIKAGFDGIVTELNVKEGSMTQIGYPVIEIQDDKDLCVYVDLLVDEALFITEGMDALVANEDTNLKIEGLKVTKIYPKAFSKISELGIEQRRIRIEVEIPEDFNLKIGMNIDVRIDTDKKDNILIVDKDAVYEKNGEKYVLLLDNNEEKEVKITTGIENSNYVEIINGLKENDIIVIR